MGNPSFRGQHHGYGAIGDRGTMQLTQRPGERRGRCDFVARRHATRHGAGIVDRGASTLDDPRRHRILVDAVARLHCPGEKPVGDVVVHAHRAQVERLGAHRHDGGKRQRRALAPARDEAQFEAPARHSERPHHEPHQPRIGDAQFILQKCAGRSREQHAADAARVNFIRRGERDVIELPALDAGIGERSARGVEGHLLQPTIRDRVCGRMDCEPDDEDIHGAAPPSTPTACGACAVRRRKMRNEPEPVEQIRPASSRTVDSAKPTLEPTRMAFPST